VQVIQRRTGGGQDFDQDYAAYQNGFGMLTGEFWLGMAISHFLKGAYAAPTSVTSFLVKIP